MKGIVDDITLAANDESSQVVDLPFHAWPQLTMTLLVRQKVAAIDRAAFERTEEPIKGKAWLGTPISENQRIVRGVAHLFALRNLIGAFTLIAMVMIGVTAFSCQVLQMAEMRRSLLLRRYFGAERTEEALRLARSSVVPIGVGAVVGSLLAVATGFGLRELGIVIMPTAATSFFAALIVILVTTAFSGVVAFWNTRERNILLKELQS